MPTSTQLDEQSRRYDQQLEQKKERAAVASRHWSSEDAPRVEAYTKKKWCTLCSVKVHVHPYSSLDLISAPTRLNCLATRLTISM